MSDDKSSSMLSKSDEPVIPANVTLPEITFRVVILGVILTIILAAANAFLGLKVGLTVAASIPAAVISMGILRIFRDSNVLENNMVQLIASVGEALVSGIVFIMPALIILHVWDGFYYWETVAAALIGGAFGTLFTIPIRRALLNDKTLRYPEGVAIGNVLKATVTKGKEDLKALTTGGIVGAVIGLCQSGFQVISDSYHYWVQTSTTVFGFGLGLSPALIGAGYIVGFNVGLSILLGVVLGWVVGVPVLISYYGFPEADSAAGMAVSVWKEHLRYVGIGTMFIGSMWTLVTLVKPIYRSIVASFEALAEAKLKGGQSSILRTERDIPMNIVFWASVLLLIPAFLLICYSIIPADAPISPGFRHFLGGFCAVYMLVGGFVFCSVTAYFAGLVGSSSSPISTMMVSSLVPLCLILMLVFGTDIQLGDTVGVVLAIGTTVVLSAGLAISNNTMQDLKVGQIVGATPWKQQLMLMFGVIPAAFVIAPILQLLYNAYGIGGVFPRPGMDPGQMLGAPQASMMAAIAKAAFTHQLPWVMLSIGAGIALICVFIDEILKKGGRVRLPVLAVGMGIYLPLEATVPLVIGAVLSGIIHIRLNRIYHRGQRDAEVKVQNHRHRGLLLACGLVAGASLMGVVLAIPFAIKQNTTALRIMPDAYQHLAGILGVVVTLALCVWVYRVTMRKETA